MQSRITLSRWSKPHSRRSGPAPMDLRSRTHATVCLNGSKLQSSEVWFAKGDHAGSAVARRWVFGRSSSPGSTSAPAATSRPARYARSPLSSADTHHGSGGWAHQHAWQHGFF